MTTIKEWNARAAELADAIEQTGVPLSAEWRVAVTAVARHALVPEFYEQYHGEWRKVSGAQEPDRHRLLDAAYSLKTLVTHVTDGRATSSSTTPTLMLRMLHWIDVQELIELARQRLAEIGYHPTLKTVNGAEGLPEHSPFDRIIATCSVPRIPTAWFEQLRPGGLLLADLKVGMNAGNLVLLRRFPDRLEGHFVDRWGSFMSLRHHPAATGSRNRPRRSPGKARERTTAITSTPWFDDLIPWFLAHLHGAVHAGATFGLDVAPDSGTPTVTNLVDVDGSWCEVELGSESRKVRQGGVRPLWDLIEASYARWEELGRPGWERFGLTVTPDTQTVWIGGPMGYRMAVWHAPEKRVCPRAAPERSGNTTAAS